MQDNDNSLQSADRAIAIAAERLSDCSFLEQRGVLHEYSDATLIPSAKALSQVKASKSPFYKKEKASDSFVSLVDFDLDAYRKMMNRKSVRRNVSIPAWLDQAAEEAHINVSRVLQEALMEKLDL